MLCSVRGNVSLLPGTFSTKHEGCCLIEAEMAEAVAEAPEPEVAPAAHDNAQDQNNNKKRKAEDEEGAEKKKKHKKEKHKSKEKEKDSSDNAEGFDLGNKKRISVSVFKKRLFVNIREYYEKDGELLPGKKGIALQPEQWQALKDRIPEIDAELARLE